MTNDKIMQQYTDFIGHAYDFESGEFNPEIAQREAESHKEKCNIILCGATGTGKSTLINAIFGKDVVKAGMGKPITEHLEKIEIPREGICLWDTKGIESKDHDGTMKKLEEELVGEFENAKNLSSLPHIGWVCIKATSSRIEDRDISLIKLLKDHEIPVIIVFTNVIGKTEKEFVEKAKETIDAEYSTFLGGAYISVNSIEYEIDEETKILARGLRELVEETLKRFPIGKENAKNAFLKAQKVKKKERLEAIKSGARNVVHAASVAAGAVGAVPLPMADAPLIAAAQSTMIYKINTEFAVDSSSSKMTSVLTGVMATTTIAQVGKAVVANALKLIPGAGMLIGGAISSATAIALTEAVGHAYIAVMEKFFDLEKGEVILPENADLIISAFTEFFSYKKVGTAGKDQ